jgi:hypothetical protein
MRSGDRVKFLNDTGGGIIIRFLDPEIVLVRIEDGFEVPVKLSELIPDNSKKADIYQDEKQQNNLIIPEGPQKEITKPVSDGEPDNQYNISELRNSGQVYLAFTHKDKSNNLKIHLINDSDYDIYYTVGSRKMEQHLHQYSGLLEADTKVVLGHIKLLKTDEPIIYSVQYLGFKTGYFKPFEPVDSLIEIDTKALVDRQYEIENDFFEEPAAIFAIATRYFSQSGKESSPGMDSAAKEFIAEKIRDKEPNKLKQDKETSNSMEVDLHIHEIVEDTSGLSDGEILDIQLRRFQMALETALIGKVKKVVFIHGVGQGKLKYEITRILHDKYPDLKYQDASFKEYGYGATMILL